MSDAPLSQQPLLSRSVEVKPAGDTPLPPYPLPAAGINWIGLWTLYLKEVRRFLNVYTQTVAAPVVTTLLFLAVFTLALSGNRGVVAGIPLAEFLAPGLIMMAMVQNAFANTSSSIVIAKVQGNIVDVMMPPLSPLELTLAYVTAGITRGLLVGVVTAIGMRLFVPLPFSHPGFILFHGVMGSAMLALLGVIGGLWSEKFDHIAAVTNFIVTPFSFLSGTFYSVQNLPQFWYRAAHLDPFFYMIDGFRFGFVGIGDGAIGAGIGVMLVINGLLSLWVWHLFRIGYKLKT